MLYLFIVLNHFLEGGGGGKVLQGQASAFKIGQLSIPEESAEFET